MRNYRILAVFAITVLAIFIFAGCGPNPKALAKEKFELTKQLSAADTDEAEKAKIETKLAKIEEKADKLSLTKRLRFEAEGLKLNVGAIGDIFDSFNDALDAQGLTDSLNDSLNELQKASDALKSLESLNN